MGCVTALRVTWVKKRERDCGVALEAVASGSPIKGTDGRCNYYADIIVINHMYVGSQEVWDEVRKGGYLGLL